MSAAEPPRVIVLGALSAIAQATARLYAAEGAQMVLAGRHGERLADLAADLTARGAKVCHVQEIDLARTDDVGDRFRDMAAALGGVDAVLLFYGILGDQSRAESDLAHARDIIQVDFASAAEWALAAANALEAQGRGALVAVSSVAGDRGRRSNYVYGASKAGLTVLIQGIAHRLAPHGARAVAIKCGFVDTPMTAAFEKSGPLWATPGVIARIVRAAAERGGPTMYAPRFWRWIMLVIRLLPTSIFNKMKV
jgi:NAD(P)-dependent dehydrogenase (short-subunit alcohol dehydrogenase family)